jgi:hypothetical protein
MANYFEHHQGLKRYPFTFAAKINFTNAAIHYKN